MTDITSVDQIDLERILQDRTYFSDVIYTPFSEALEELQKRSSDQNLKEVVEKGFSGTIPEPFLSGPRAVLLRYMATPNYEILRFLHLTHDVEGITQLLCEYPEDKFFPSNVTKRLLGKLTFFKQWDWKGAIQTQRINIIDFVKAEGKKLSEITTLWDEPLLNFHHTLFKKVYPHPCDTFNISTWYEENGPKAKEYYLPLMLLFIRHGILFENFMLHDKEESPFIKNVFLPAFLEAFRITGKRPLIVAFEPTDIEGNKFWLSYPFSEFEYVAEHMNGSEAKTI